MNPQILIHTFETDSLPLAAYLIASGSLRLLDTDASNPRDARFIFVDEKDQGPELEQLYSSGQAMVSASLFHSALRRLRRAIDSKSSTGRNSGQSSTSNAKSQQLRGNHEHATFRSR